MTLTVFTDGACSNNGKPGAKAGLGVYFGEGDKRNTSKRIIGRQTNNTAELSAIIEVFEILKNEMDKEIIIYSDSKVAIGWVTSTGDKYSKKLWTGKIPNVELIKEGYGLFKSFPNVSIEHIRAHTGLTDELSLGNDGADRMANEAIGVFTQRHYLQIPFSEKEVGKKYGTKWDKTKKKWFYEGLTTDDNFDTLCQLFPL
jgi:ribonuclease HI|tara:strand:+ start:225 stop:824 length:600 start_codon:yes stop_codon:yes gene_type:complete